MRVVIALYFYSGTCDYQTISNLFRIAPSTVCNIVHVVSEVIVEKLLPKTIRLPNEIEVQIINNTTRSCNIVAGWSKYYFDF